MDSEKLLKLFKKKIRYALKDETKAIKFYNNMIQMVPNENIRDMIIEIRNDELDHHKKLSNLRLIFGK